MACPIQDCENPVKLDGYLCADHSCSINNCIFERVFINYKEYKYCVMHTCRKQRNYQCSNLQMPGYKYCDRHKCSLSNCAEYSEYGLPCHKHRCKSSECCKSIEDGENWCKDHICKVCSVKPTMDRKSFCEMHGCRYFLCKEQSLDQHYYCNKHICKYDDCENLSDTESYCEIHKCVYKYCREKKENGINSCAKHICVSCTNTRAILSLGCTHKCGKKECEKASIESKEYCNKHKCKFNGCDKSQLPQHYYSACLEHICCSQYELGCCSIKMPKSSVCKAHKCLISSCPNEKHRKQGIEYTYCHHHRCNTDECYSMKHPQFLSCYCHLSENSKAYIQYTLSDYGKIMIKDINNIMKQYIVF